MVEYTEFLGFNITLNGNTYTTKDIQLPNARVMQAPAGRYGRAQMIPTVVVHAIEYQMPTLDGTADFTINVQLTRNPQTALINIDNKDLIDMIRKQVVSETAVGFEVKQDVMHDKHEFSPPIVVPEVAISLGAICSGANTTTVYGRIHYTIRWMEATQSLAATVR